MAKKWCGQMKSNDNYFDDSWFSGVKTYEEVMTGGVAYYGPVQTSNKYFCLATFRNVDERLAGRVISCYGEYSKSTCW